MPSPFPGMDPYLEGSLWMSVHSQLCAEIARQLAPKLSPRYLALTTERFVLEAPEDIAVTATNIYPDVGVAPSGQPGSGAAGTAIAPAPLRLTTAMPSAVPHVSVEIRDARQRRLVTAIEVLSPTNKRGDGREEYLVKRNRLLLSAAHLVEIDLLHQGQRVPMLERLPPAPYFVFVSRVENRPVLDVYPVRLQDVLPTVQVPLLTGDADVPLDLQLALTTIYELLHFDLAVDYGQPPEIALPAEEAAWVEERLRGYRTAPHGDGAAGPKGQP